MLMDFAKWVYGLVGSAVFLTVTLLVFGLLGTWFWSHVRREYSKENPSSVTVKKTDEEKKPMSAPTNAATSPAPVLAPPVSPAPKEKEPAQAKTTPVVPKNEAPATAPKTTVPPAATVAQGVATRTIRNRIKGGRPDDVALLPDGKLLIVGGFNVIDDEIHEGLARLNPDGFADTSFNGQLPSGGFAIGLLPDGGFLVNSNSGTHRLSPSGTIDKSFPSISGGRTLLVEPDGSFFLSSGKYSSKGSLLVRFQESFETHGMAKQTDGKILLGGTSAQLLRLNPDGTRDPSFQPPRGIKGGNIHALAVQKDGGIVVTGGAFALLPNVFRLKSDGQVDESFESATQSNGSVRCLDDGSVLVAPNSSNGKIIVDSAGRIISVGPLVRLAQNGRLHEKQLSLDSKFDSGASVFVYAPVN